MSDPWEVVPLRDEVHIVPVNDLFEHHLDGTGCVCGPEVEQQHKRPLIIHASLDGRELLEQQDPPADEGS